MNLGEDFKFVFFGSADFSVLALNELKARGVIPSLVVTTSDKPKGRKLLLTPNVVKVWAQENNIEVETSINKEKLEQVGAEFFLVVAYGKLIKKEIFDIPRFKTLNIHPSLLPKYRGASPMISQILNDEQEVGTSIMLIDEGMDTGPVLAQKKVAPENWPISISELEIIMAKESVSLLLDILPRYLSGELISQPQNDAEATYSEKIKKEDGLLDLEGDAMPTGRQARGNLLKIKAFSVWPRAYYFIDTPKRSEGDTNKKRIIVTDATLDESGKLELLKVIPEGKNEMSYEDFMRGQK